MERINTPRNIAKKIKTHLDENSVGTFTVGDNRVITMSAVPSVLSYFGKQYDMAIHDPVPDTPLFSSAAVEIVTFPRVLLQMSSVIETLQPTIRRGSAFVPWDAGKDNSDAVEDKDTQIQPYKHDLSAFAEVLRDPRLQQVYEEEPTDLLVSMQAKTRVEKLFLSAFEGAKSRRAKKETRIKKSDYIASYGIGEIEVHIDCDPGIPGLKKPNYSFILHKESDSAPEIYSFNKRYMLVVCIGTVRGNKIYAPVSASTGKKLASTLGQFDENDIIR